MVSNPRVKKLIYAPIFVIIMLLFMGCRETQAGEWIVGWGWDEGAWAKNYPSNEELSAISPENPVYLRGYPTYPHPRISECQGGANLSWRGIDLRA
ncbi:MAG: hypothetical protein WBF32_05740 [Candidatus Aminicenantaceae bacterium]